MGAIAAALVCLAIELLILRPNRLQFSSPLNSVIAEKRSLIKTSAEADFAILGDSRFFHLVPSSLGSESARGVNLSWAWCGYEVYDVMLRAALEAAPGLRRVYVPGSPEIISYSPKNVSATENPDYRERLFQAAPLMAQLASIGSMGKWQLLWDQLERGMMPPSYVYGPALITRGMHLLRGGKC